MTEQEFDKLMQQEGIVLAWKEGDSMYPIPIGAHMAGAIKMVLSTAEIQVPKVPNNRYVKNKDNK